MIKQEALTLGDEPLPVVRVHATAIFNILNNFIRRDDRNFRVLGTLLGMVKSNDGNVIEVTDCFGVPHQEKTDELYVAINTEYHRSMYNFHNRIYRREQIVGWYTTSTPDGALIIDNSTPIHEFYCGECNDPIHLVVDTTLAGENLGIRAFVMKMMVVGVTTLANMFQEVKVEIAMSDAEISCLHHMIHGQKESWNNSIILSDLGDERQALAESIEKLSSVVDKISAYVDNVVDGKEMPLPELGIAIADALESVQLVRADDFHSIFKERTQDLVMVSYLSTLTQTQLYIAEKISSVL